MIGRVFCANCGREAGDDDRFCSGCGRPLNAAPELEGERKQVTVLFADVMGSMDLAEQHDPEEWRAIMDRFFAILSAGVERFGGTVDKFTGDGIMALFGAPVAHEDHARRACFAALHLQEALSALDLSVRMGLNSGEVIAAPIATAYTAVGHTVGLAQRMESLAEPGSAYLTEHTAALVAADIELTDLGEHAIKGSSRPLRVFKLLAGGAGDSRPRSRFVGRERELRSLEDALGGEGQVVGIVGEAGVGKSRLVHEFTELAESRGLSVYHVAAQAHAKSLPLVPVLRFMRTFFGIAERDPDELARERIAARLEPGDVPLMSEFLGVADPDHPAEQMDPQARQRQLLRVMKRLIRSESELRPGVTIFEDLHWLDPASEVFLANHIEGVQGTRHLTIVDFRPEYHADWMTRSYYRQIALAPLTDDATGELVAHLLGTHPQRESLTGLIRERTGGNPFFVEELVQTLAETGSLDDATVPATVQAVLAARIDRLSARDKSVLQAAAVIGKEFSEPVLEHVVDVAGEALSNLVRSEFIYERELYPEAIYAFKHPLTQEVAYRSQLAERRTRTHAAVAEAIAAHRPDRADEDAALIAQHWEAAAQPAEAVRWHARAAAWVGRRDLGQASLHWSRVHALAAGLPETGETVALQLRALLSLLDYGWRLDIAIEEADALFAEAEAITAAAGDLSARAVLFQIYGLIVGGIKRDSDAWVYWTRQAFALAEESGDRDLYLSISLGAYPLFLRGEFDDCRTILDRALELADGDPTVGSGMTGGCQYAWVLEQKGALVAMCGEFDEASRLLDEGRRIAGEQGDYETVGFGLCFAALVEYIRGDVEAALSHAREALEIAERIGSSFSRVWAWTWVGWTQHEHGDPAEIIPALEHAGDFGIGRGDSEGARLFFLGEALFRAGDVERGRALVDEGLVLCDEAQALVGRVLGNIAFARITRDSDRPAAAAALDRGLEIAETHGATAMVPMVHAAMAELAQLGGDRERCRHWRELALRGFTAIGATGRAERLMADVPQFAG